ncbi:PREDICTED: 28S ribosomal protein S31, mitochondrial-like [Branchiostoma belcheri]|uniref:Small ribosomal subunit protein mS31 n=1 Tax=Branchiostoma belcheri TaxID=7741 RepID=A0A6P4YHB2_BRABE|nr:PREDICTED: 28S ribosomal protein S31, mitochondrial-like [Branchiostoma belcheri]
MAAGCTFLFLSSTSQRIAGLGARLSGVRLGTDLPRCLHTAACLLKKSGDRPSDRSTAEVDPELAAAAKAVAERLGGEKVESDLLQQLRRHEVTTSAGKASAADNSSLGDLISGLRVERGPGQKNRAEERTAPLPGPRGGGAGRRDQQLSVLSFVSRPEIKNFHQEFQQRKQTQPRSEQVGRTSPSTRRSLFEGKRLGVFKPEEVKNWQVEGSTLWCEEQTAELQTQVDLPPRNGFEEMIKWTKEGKMWTFPIQNDQGLEDEATVGFHEHVFLDDLLEDFPQKGPIRHFMELVITGLSKNPYLTLQQKREHVDWFRKYFQETEPILRASGSLTE